MLNIDCLDDVRGNNVVIYSIKTLLSKNTFPKFTILAGHMGVGKSTVAGLIAKELDQTDTPVKVFNFGMDIDMKMLEEQVFKMNPSTPKAFIFEELHGLDKSQQTALLTMIDRQPSNVYIIATTTESYKILKTIRSRAQVWDFKLLSGRQLTQLLDDYLLQQGVEMSKSAKNALLKSCYGVPRDLLKNADLAISGDFTGEQLDELLGHVSEDLIFSLLLSLKSTSIDFSTNILDIINLMDNTTNIIQLRDFYTRYLLERKGLDNPTIDKNKLETLDATFTEEERVKIAKTLIRATPATLPLELAMLNMTLTNTSTKKQIGQQIDRIAINNNKAVEHHSTMTQVEKREAARVTAADLGGMMFGQSKK